MKKLLIIIGILGACAVVLGAFGAHALVPKLSAASLASYKTGVLYHFIHVLAAMAAMILYINTHQRLFKTSAILFLVGIIFFSGSIYLLATRELTNLTVGWLGPVTPIGGVIFILAWLVSALAASKIEILSRSDKKHL